MGSLLSPFLKMGVTHALVQSFGKCPVLIDFWKITARRGSISLYIFFKTKCCMQSGPDALCGFSFCKGLIMPFTEVVISAVIGILLCKSVGTE